MTLMQWVIAAIIMFIVEIGTPGVLFFACLGVGALSAGLCAFLQMPVWMQWADFIFVSIASMYFIRPLVKKMFKIEKTTKTNTEALIGQKALVEQEITPSQMGSVKIGGEVWRAESEEKIEKNAWVEVVKIDGTHLKVKKT